jgi:hypothetical protein
VRTATQSNDPEGANHECKDVSVSLKERTVIVTGSTDLIVTVGQQLAWITAAFRASNGHTVHSHFFFDLDPPGSDHEAVPTFRIGAEIDDLDAEETRGCWTDFIPGLAIAAGFTIPPRLNGETGLELNLGLMSALGGISNATQFAGGYVLKGRTVMFVPMKRIKGSVQWHFLKSSAGKIQYKDARTRCPTRLMLKDFDRQDFLSTRAFLDFCGTSVNELGRSHLSFCNNSAQFRIWSPQKKMANRI